MSRRSSRRGRTAPAAFPSLSEGIQNGLRRLVEDNASTVAKMLDVVVEEEEDGTAQVAEVLCEKCAQVMKQQQLSASCFLARFFQDDMLSEHAILCGKSGKGSAATLGDRIAAVWAQNKPIAEKKKEHKQEKKKAKAKAKKENRDEDSGNEDEDEDEESSTESARKQRKKGGKETEDKKRKNTEEGGPSQNSPKKTKKKEAPKKN